MLVDVVVRDHIDRAAPLYRMRGDGAKLDEHRAHTRAQGDLERVRHAMPLEDSVHARLRE